MLIFEWRFRNSKSGYWPTMTTALAIRKDFWSVSAACLKSTWEERRRNFVEVWTLPSIDMIIWTIERFVSVFCCFCVYVFLCLGIQHKLSILQFHSFNTPILQFTLKSLECEPYTELMKVWVVFPGQKGPNENHWKTSCVSYGHDCMSVNLT